MNINKTIKESDNIELQALITHFSKFMNISHSPLPSNILESAVRLASRELIKRGETIK